MSVALVGRDGELAELVSLARACALGAGGCAVVEGVAGIGKTALLDAFAAEISVTLGARVLRGRSWEEGGAPPYWPWPEIAAAAGWDVAWTQRDPFALYQHVGSLARTEAERSDGPLVLLLDDLHAADDDAVRLTRFVARGVSGEQFLLVIGTRPSDRLTSLTRLGRQVVLTPLSPEQAQRMVAELAIAPLDAATTTTICARAEGNPLFLRELTRSMRVGRAVPSDLLAVVSPTIAEQPASTRALLELAAVFGRSFRADLLARAAGRSELDVLDALEPLRRSDVLVVEGTPPACSFSHQLVRDVVYEHLAASARCELHARAADAVLATDAPDSAAEAARHLLCAVPVVEVGRAIDAARRAAALASARAAHAEAAALLGRIADVVQGAERIDVLLALGEARRASGEVASATRAFDEAIELARATPALHGRLPELVLARTELVAWSAEAAALVTLIDEARRETGGSVPGDDHGTAHALDVRLLARRAALVAMGTELDAARRDAMAALDAGRALTPADDEVLAEALAAVHRTCWGPDDLAVARTVGRELIEVATRLGDDDRLGEALLGALIDSLRAGDLSAADAALDRYGALAQRTGRPRHQFFLLSRRAMRAFLAGRLAEGESLIERAYDLAQRIEEPDARQVFHGARMVVVDELDPREEILAAARAVEEVALAGEVRVNVHTAHSYLRAGHLAEARTAIERLARSLPALSLAHLPLYDLCLVAEVVAACGPPALVAPLLDTLRPHAGLDVVNAGAVTHGGVVDEYLGMLERSFGRQAEAGRWFASALDRYRVLGAAWFAARAERSLGAPPAAPAAPALQRRTFVFRPRGEGWEVGDPSAPVVLRDARGLHHVHALLRARGQEVAAAELAGGAQASELAARQAHHALLDDRAKAAYRRRVRELQTELDDADAAADLERSAAAHAELDLLLDELRRAVGLGGRDRPGGAIAERARVAVRKAVAAATERIAVADPQLAHVLRTSVHTGHWCRYEADPVNPIEWVLD